MNTEEFLTLFHSNKEMYFWINDSRTGYSQNKYGEYNEEMIRFLQEKNDEGYDIYFYVNSGGTRVTQINKVNAVFADFDAGRDSNKKYYGEEYVQVYKERVLKRIHDFGLKPSIIVETRNGLHVYWLVNPGALSEQFTECQNRIINYFGSDEQIKNLNRVMRVPAYWWSKAGYERFMSKVIENNDVRYDIEEVIDCLPEVSKKKKTNKTKKQDKQDKQEEVPMFETNKGQEDNIDSNAKKQFVVLIPCSLEIL